MVHPKGAQKMRLQYADYIKRLEEIRRLSTPTLTGISRADGYSDRLQENFAKIGMLAAENRAFLQSVLMPVLDGTHRLTAEETDDLLAFGEHLISAVEAENLDLPIMSLVSRKLIRDAQTEKDLSAYIRLLDVRMDTCYAMMNLMGRVTAYPTIANKRRQEGLEIGREICAFLDQAYELLAGESVSPEGKTAGSEGPGPDPGYYAFVCEKCAPAFSYYGYFLAAQELERRAKEIYERN